MVVAALAGAGPAATASTSGGVTVFAGPPLRLLLVSHADALCVQAPPLSSLVSLKVKTPPSGAGRGAVGAESRRIGASYAPELVDSESASSVTSAVAAR